jgi:hypothetical protein
MLRRLLRFALKSFFARGGLPKSPRVLAIAAFLALRFVQSRRSKSTNVDQGRA